jgi:hypothetical protein
MRDWALRLIVRRRSISGEEAIGRVLDVRREEEDALTSVWQSEGARIDRSVRPAIAKPLEVMHHV